MWTIAMQWQQCSLWHLQLASETWKRFCNSQAPQQYVQTLTTLLADPSPHAFAPWQETASAYHRQFQAWQQAFRSALQPAPVYAQSNTQDHPEANTVAGLIRLGMLLAQLQTDVPAGTKALSLEWLREQPLIARMPEEALWLVLQQQSQLIWEDAAGARASLSALFADTASRQEIHRLYAERLAGFVDSGALRQALDQLLPDATSPRKPARRTTSTSSKTTTGSKRRPKAASEAAR